MSALLPALLLALLPGAPGVPGGDPFLAGLRWRDEPGVGSAWIPRDATFVGPGELVWASRSGAEPALVLHAAEPGEAGGAPLLVDDTLAGALGPLRVAAGDRADELYALVQLPAAEPLLRRTLVTRHDAFHPSGPGTFRARWVHDLGRLVNASGRLACSPDGEVLVAALLDDARREVLLERLDPATGDPLARRVLPTLALRALAVSDDGSTVALLLAEGLQVLAAGDLGALHAVPAGTPTEALALSEHGDSVAFGDGRFLRRTVRSGAGWKELPALAAPAGELVVLAASDAAARVLGAASWSPAEPGRARARFFEAASGALLSDVVVGSAASGLQDLPTRLRLTPDGRRALLALWGAGDDGPEVLLLEPASGRLVLSFDAQGSVDAADLDATGTRVVVAARERHANEVSLRGALLGLSTGERELLLLEPARAGGLLRVGAERPGAAAWFFAVGTPAPAPRVLSGLLSGELWLDPRGPLRLYGLLADGAGRADLRLDLPAALAGSGLALAVQAAGGSPAGWSLAAGAAFPELF